MRILTIYDSFNKGGLESQVQGQARALAAEGVEMYLATGASIGTVQKGIFRAGIGDLSLSSTATFAELRDSLERIHRFIETHKITVIHAHPFFSIIVGALVAQKSSIPLLLTLHGPASITGMKAPVVDLLFRAVVLPAARPVYCVSRETELLCQAQVKCETKVLPNAIEIPKANFASPSSLSGPWMWAGRIDIYKLPGLRDLIEKMQGLGHPLHIYGEGPEEDQLAELIYADGDSYGFVDLRGWVSSLPDVMSDYALVAGMGRVILEAAARNRSCLLVSYDGVKGLLNRAGIERAGFWNFSGRGHSTIDQPCLVLGLQKWQEVPSDYALSDWVSEYRSDLTIWGEYLSDIKAAQPTRDPALATVLDALHLQGDSNEEIWHSMQFTRLLEGLLGNSGRAGKRSNLVSQRRWEERLIETQLQLRIERDHLATHRAALSAELAAARQESAGLREHLAEEATARRRETEIANALRAECDNLGSRLAEETAAHQHATENLKTAREQTGELHTRLTTTITAQQHEFETACGLRDQLKAAQEKLSAQSMEVENLKRRCDFWECRTIALENSTLWKCTHPLRMSIEAGRLLTAELGQTKLRISHVRSRLRKDGYSSTAKWIVDRLSKGRADSIPQTAAVPHDEVKDDGAERSISTSLGERDKRYRNHTNAEYQRFSEQMSLDIDDALLEDIKAPHKRLVIAPVAYDLSLTQRPDHILRALARDDKYVCVFVEINGDDLHFTKRDDDIYVTNNTAALYRFAKTKKPIIYIHYALFAYMLRLFPNAFFIYDVLDDPSIFADFCPELERDHAALLQNADVVLFSAHLLQDRYGSQCAQHLLIGNGVWPEDFSLLPSADETSSNTLRIGYHGAISELLDFALLNKIARLPDVQLLLLGPVVAFDASQTDRLQREVDQLNALANVTFLGKRPYSEVRHYLAQIDIGIIPFIPNQATDAISPLKLFEFIAAYKPVLASPTKTVMQYKDIINVAEATDISEVIRRRSWRRVDESAYASILREHDWGSLVDGLREVLAKSATDSRRTRVCIERKKTLDIINVNFFDWNGEVLYKGGAERYVADLAEIGNKRGYAVRIIQRGNYAFERNFQGMQVLGVVDGGAHWDFARLSGVLSRVVSSSDVVIASPLELACKVFGDSRVIGINHGIHWDLDLNRHENKGNYDLIIAAARNCQSVVCVDTNFMNWFRTIDWPLAQKLQYIPNYVGEEFFTDADKNFSGKLNVLYPRRLYKPRGLYITLPAFGQLFAEFDDLHLTFCGQADEVDTRNVHDFIRRYDGRVSWIERDMNEMPSVYQASHISLIPTLYAEGTALLP